MKRTGVVLSGIISILIFTLIVNAEDNAKIADDQWPKSINAENAVFKIYQPQLDSWDGFMLRAHSAIGVQKQGDKNQVTYGVMDFTVNTIVDKDTRLVSFEKMLVNGVKFPSSPEYEQEYLKALSDAAPLEMKSMSLDRLESNLAILEEQKKNGLSELSNEPPKIIFSHSPAILVYIDGKPAFRPVKSTNLSRVLNTRVLLLRDSSGKYYLHVFDGYMEVDALDGNWTVSRNRPAGSDIAAKDVEDVDLLDGAGADEKSKPSLAKGPAPRIIVSFVPAELIVTGGEPNFTPIDGTNLLYVSNTTANIFEDMSDQKLYVLISGRWFRSGSEAGPWEYVTQSQLPPDYAKIPDSSAKENVKASVAGTGEAQEAVIANSIPTTSKIARSTAKMTLEIDGNPQLKPISGTDLYYVFNCSVPVIKISENEWYAVYNGIWFTAKNVSGPWVAADYVPAVIYSIPASSPLHYVTYVKVYNSDADYVYVGYTPGYYGTVISADGTVVYGTGYYYPSYIGDNYWFSPFYSYGYGAGLCWTPWYGWSFSFGFGWGFGDPWYYPPFPYWGPFYVWRHDFHYRFYPWELNTALNGYHRFNHRPGQHIIYSDIGHFGRAYNSRTGSMVAGNSHAIRKVFNSRGSWAPASTAAVGASRPRAQVSGNQVYGTPSGHVYYYNKKGKTGNWNHLNNRSDATESSQNKEVDNLNRERSARDEGETRANSYKGYRGGESMGNWGGHEGGSRGRGGWRSR